MESSKTKTSLVRAGVSSKFKLPKNKISKLVIVSLVSTVFLCHDKNALSFIAIQSKSMYM